MIFVRFVVILCTLAWILFAVSAWSSYAQALSTGNLDYYVHNVDGTTVPMIRVLRYDSSWHLLDNATTDSSGKAAWTNIPIGTYNFESYNRGSLDGWRTEYWGDAAVNVKTGNQTYHFTRFMPWVWWGSVHISDTAGNAKTTFKIGDTVRMSVTVENDVNYAMTVKLGLVWDQDQQAPYDIEQYSSPTSISSKGTATFIIDTVIPASLGGSTLHLAAWVNTTLLNGNIWMTDSWIFTQSTIQVEPPIQVTFQLSGVGSDSSVPLLTIDGDNYLYSQFPVVRLWPSGSTHSYAWLSTAAAGSGKQYTWVSSSGITTSRSGTISPTSSGSATGNYNTQYYLWVKSERATTSGSGWYTSGQIAQFNVTPSEVNVNEGTRYVVSGYSGDAIGASTSGSTLIDRPKVISFNWKTQYLLSLVSQWGTPSGTGWYDSASSVTFTITGSPMSISEGISRVFTQWYSSDSGGYTGSSQARTITLNNPVTEEAVWENQGIMNISWQDRIYQVTSITNASITSLGIFPSNYGFRVLLDNPTTARISLVLPLQLLQATGSETSRIMIFLNGELIQPSLSIGESNISLWLDLSTGSDTLLVYYNSYEAHIRVLSLITGQPIPDASVTIRSEVMPLMWSGRTDSEGVFVVRLPPLSYRVDVSAFVTTTSQAFAPNSDGILELRLFNWDDLALFTLILGVLIGLIPTVLRLRSRTRTRIAGQNAPVSRRTLLKEPAFIEPPS